MRLVTVGLITGLALTTACGDKTTIYNNPTGPSTVTPTTPTAPITSKIEFRVTGNVGQVRVRMSNPIDGFSQVVTALPYSNSFNTLQDTLFLSLEVTPLGLIIPPNPFMAAQIYVNGNVFREDIATDGMSSLLISGNWRR